MSRAFQAMRPAASSMTCVRPESGRPVPGNGSRAPWLLRRAPVAASDQVRILGVRIANVSKLEAVEQLHAILRVHPVRAHSVFIVNAHTLNLASEHPHYRDVLNSADAVYGDGTGVRWAARLQGVRMVDNLVGTDLVPFFMMRSRAERYRYFLLGGRPAVVEAAAAHVQKLFVGSEIAGWHHGHFAPEEDGEVMRRINAARPDVLLVAMGNPLQEEWIAGHLPHLHVPLCIGVGGLVDHWGGALTRAPDWVRRRGLEWTQILLQQPHKWRRYLVGNPVFLHRALATGGRQ